MFHALTGCDTVSSFTSKKTAWAVWTVLPELTESLLLLSSAPRDIPDDAMCIIESSGGTCQEGSVLRWTVWGQILLPAPELPPPTNWGWSRTGEGQYTPYWTRLPKAAHSCIELVSCKCKKGCVRRCKCKKAALQCTALCVCEGDCT
ncbi:hypothetical protein ACOMHN_054586 [Nucella lapillus]